MRMFKVCSVMVLGLLFYGCPGYDCPETGLMNSLFCSPKPPAFTPPPPVPLPPEPPVPGPDTPPVPTPDQETFDRDGDGFCPEGRDLNSDGDCDDEGERGPDVPGDCNDADPNVFPGAVEVCDGVDNNCNGVVDEGCECVVGLDRECGTTVGECTKGVQVCTPEGWGMCEGAVLPRPEVCDADFLDEDCDGVANNGCECVHGETGTTGSDVGECSTGEKVCDNGVWLSCYPNETGFCNLNGTLIKAPVGPSDEVCDGLDNNCNGVVDDGCECVVGSVQECGTDVGACTVGTQVCTSNGWGACTGVLPSTELCDGLDNNCNGAVDEGCKCVVGTVKSCGSNVGVCEAGTTECVAVKGGTKSTWTSCVGQTVSTDEVCDGLDNNCNGVVDEGCVCTPGTVKTCGTDVGVCSPGVKTCVDGFSWTACSGDGFVSPSPEVCDGVDNDCDGQVDEGCECVVGSVESCGDHCSAGERSCTPEGWGECEVKTSCGECVCGTSRACGPETSVGECNKGIQFCQDDQTWSDCFGATHPTEEVCNGLDNDCDGTPDNGCECVVGSVQECGTDVGACTVGTQTCSPTGWGRCTGTRPRREVCDGVDNNCNGVVDEGCECVVGSVQECGTNVGECTKGVQTCMAGKRGKRSFWGHCENSVGPSKEICDGLDNNCDGVVDPGCECELDDVKPCSDGPEVGLCKNGTQTCVPDFEAMTASHKKNKGKKYVTATKWSECTGQVLPQAEVCDGQDNDCDGTPDFQNGLPVCLQQSDNCTAVQNPTLGKSYLFCTNRVNWKMANDNCASEGGRLVEIRSSVENAFVFETAKTLGWDKLGFWHGATDQAHEGTWTWNGNEHFWTGTGREFLDGKPGTGPVDDAYHNWALVVYQTEYNKHKQWTNLNNDGNEDCGEMMINMGYHGNLYTNGEWNDHKCHTKLQYVCQFDQADENNEDKFCTQYKGLPGPTWGLCNATCNAIKCHLDANKNKQACVVNKPKFLKAAKKWHNQTLTSLPCE